MSESTAISQILNTIPKDTVNALGHMMFKQISPVVFVVVGERYTGKFVLSQAISTGLGVSQMLDLCVWHLPNTDTSLSALQKHIPEWLPKGEFIQFRQCQDREVLLDNVVSLLNGQIRGIVVYVESVKHLIVHDETILEHVELLETTTVVPESERDVNLYGRVSNEKPKIISAIKHSMSEPLSYSNLKSQIKIKP